MFQFTLRGLVVHTAFVGLALALARAEFVAGGVVLGAAVAAAHFAVPIRTWRFATYGGLAGIVVAILLLACCAAARPGDPPPRAVRHGELEFFERFKPFAFQVGALAGGTAGLLMSRRAAR